MKNLSKSNSTLLFIILTGILIVVAFISHNKILQYNASVEEMTRISKVKQTIETVLSNLKDAEIEQGAYLLTGDAAYLKSFTLEAKNRNCILDTLELLIGNNHQQQENFKKLKSIVHERYAILDSNVVILKNNFHNPLTNEAMQRGMIKMDEVKSQILLMLEKEDEILTENTNFKDRTASITPVFLLGLSLLSIVVITFFFFRLQKETNERITITESNKLLQEAKQKIEVSEKRFRTLSETIPHMIWTATPDGKKTFFNKFFFDYTGYTFEELEGEGWHKIVFPADLEREISQWHEIAKTGENLTIEKRLRHHSGEYRWHITRGIAQKNNEGDVTGWIGTSTEIDDQKKITEILTKAEEQLRIFANSIQNLAWIANSDGLIYWYNQRWYDYTRCTLEEMQGSGWEKVHHPDHIEKVRKFVKEAWKKNEAFELTFPLRRYDGEYRWFLSRAYPVNDDAGNIERWIGTNTDITEQRTFAKELEIQVKERTQELQIKNQTFEIAEKIATLGSYKWNIKTNVLEYSNNLFRLLDCEPQEFIPTIEKFTSFVHPDDLQQVNINREKTLQKGALVESPYRIISKTGNIKYFRSVGVFSCEGDNHILIGTVQDISEDIAASKELEAKNIELETINAELASFNYVASHDLQEPLRKIQGFSKRIIDREEENLSDTAKDYFKRINAAAKRMQNLITSILSYSRTNNVEMSFEKTDLNQTLNEVKSTLQESILAKNAVIESQELPIINAIPVQMHQLFLNLISNSIKYAKQDTFPLIKITAKKVILNEPDGQIIENTPYWEIAISDNGIGFEQQYEDRIFEVFQRLHGKNEYEGTGIGLAICKKIIQIHQGTISVIGKPGIGTTFIFLLPENNISNKS
ncbi:MAG: PAS domain-containing protein [Bacteroidales bacterium]|nr:PAS domain-containing protein [Bacteroidales bacterium]